MLPKNSLTLKDRSDLRNLMASLPYEFMEQGILSPDNKLPCGKESISISQVSFSGEEPETIKCGERNSYCISCISRLNRILDENDACKSSTASFKKGCFYAETQEHIEEENDFSTSTENLIEDEISEENTKEPSPIWKSFMNYVTSPKGALVTTAGALALTAAAYVAYQHSGLFENGILDIVKREQDLQSEIPPQPITDPAPQPEQTIKILHEHSLLRAVQALHENENSTVNALLEFKNGSCQETLISSLFPGGNANVDQTSTSPSLNQTRDLTFGGKVQWTSDSNEVSAAIVSMDKSEFTHLLGAVVTQSECFESASFESLLLPKMQSEIQKNARIQGVQGLFSNLEKEINGVQNSDCVENNEDVLVLAGLTGNNELTVKEVKCTPRLIRYTRPNEEQLNSPEALAAKEACVRRIAFVSSGINNSSDVAEVVESTLTFGSSPEVINGKVTGLQSMPGGMAQNVPSASSEMVEKYLRSALRRCPDLRVTDIRAATQVKGEREGEASAWVLPSQNVLQVLDHVLNQEYETRPDRIVILDIDEQGNYHPDSTLISNVAQQLGEEGIPVQAFASSENSWLSRVPHIAAIDDVTESLVRGIKTIRWDRALKTAALSSGAAASLAGALLIYCGKKTKKNGPPNEDLEAVRMNLLPSNNDVQNREGDIIEEIESDKSQERGVLLLLNNEDEEDQQEVGEGITDSQENDDWPSLASIEHQDLLSLASIENDELSPSELIENDELLLSELIENVEPSPSATFFEPMPIPEDESSLRRRVTVVHMENETSLSSEPKNTLFFSAKKNMLIEKTEVLGQFSTHVSETRTARSVPPPVDDVKIKKTPIFRNSGSYFSPIITPVIKRGALQSVIEETSRQNISLLDTPVPLPTRQPLLFFEGNLSELGARRKCDIKIIPKEDDKKEK